MCEIECKVIGREWLNYLYDVKVIKECDKNVFGRDVCDCGVCLRMKIGYFNGRV